MENASCDVMIIGAGPAGATLAMILSGSGLRVTVADKDRFPRDKVCGDAMSGQVVNILKRLPAGIYQDFLDITHKAPSRGIRFTSPGMKSVDLTFSTGEGPPADPPGYICPRKVFDHFLVSKMKSLPGITFLEETRVIGLTAGPDHITARTESGPVMARLVAGADGVHSICSSLLGNRSGEQGQLCTGIRGYFEHVGGMHPWGYIELFFLRELLPFYFWIFPEVDGLSNVGLAMLRNRISKDKVSLGRVFDHVIRDIPYFSERFRNARLAGSLQAHTLPLGRTPGRLSGDRFLLLGDAASLVDAFSGEGIGNAMASAEVAAGVILQAFKREDLSGSFLSLYDEKIKKRMGRELKTSYALQRLSVSRHLFDFIVGKASRSKGFNDLLSSAFGNEEIRSKLVSPRFLLDLLFR
jgi:menaquinone-9 beta-reductase